jgi:hypothetical protein
MQSYNPRGARSASLGSSLFARHYLGNHYYFLFLRVLRCFSSPGWLPAFGGMLYLQYSGLSHSEIPGYNACVQLSRAYRSLPRPSSPLRPKASTIRPYVALKKLKLQWWITTTLLYYVCVLILYNSLSQYVKELLIIPSPLSFSERGAKDHQC